MVPIRSQLFFPSHIQQCRFLSLISAAVSIPRTTCLTSHHPTVFFGEVPFTVGSLKIKSLRRKSTLLLNMTFGFNDTKEQSPIVGLESWSPAKMTARRQKIHKKNFSLQALHSLVAALKLILHNGQPPSTLGAMLMRMGNKDLYQSSPQMV